MAQHRVSKRRRHRDSDVVVLVFKKVGKLKDVPDSLTSAEQLATISSALFQDQALDVKAEPSELLEVKMKCDEDAEARQLEEELRNPIKIRQSATEEAAFYKCEVCLQLYIMKKRN